MSRTWITPTEKIAHLSKCDGHLYLEFTQHGVPMTYVAPEKTEELSPQLLEQQLREFELACRAASLVLNEQQTAHMVGLLNQAAKAHEYRMETYRRRANQLATEDMFRKASQAC
ncbi:hypothetical protein RQP54_18000 [Curvibacter sp. APW13]|uniref:hypothetical protein n=1 Tax=Curvibacter sp. APW13 TaxID=3077236 RepID=UPI0028E05D2C|nr:hypothetical protein [Curvibacter sp. APW13]MDT8992771.1 hypothetical protein [Curvibacter sp. APW13]